MRWIVVADSEAVAEAATTLVEEAQPRVLGVATGATPLPLYRRLVARRSLAPTTRLCLLDEYIDLSPDDPRRFRNEILRVLAEPLDIPPGQVYAPLADGTTDPEEYDGVIADLGGVDLQILGVGRNGHIAFNEPGTPADSTTHVAVLTEATRLDNARHFPSPEVVPQRAVTQGLATILRARRIVLLAAGSAKREALAALATGAGDSPVTVLATHPDLTVIADRDAAPIGAEESR